MKRRLARELAVQSLYSIEMNDIAPEEAVSSVIGESLYDEEDGGGKADMGQLVPFVLELVKGATEHIVEIDRLLADYLKGWQIDRLSRVDRQVLRLAVHEMVFRDDAPPKVAINEAIELAKHFGTEESGKFVNGVLGKMLKDLDEIKARVRVKSE